MKKIINYISQNWPFFFVFFAIGFNLLMLFPETQIKMDLNDNVFAFTLIEHMNKILSSLLSTKYQLLNTPLLLDHWIPEWSMGFPVFSYYQHIPHLTVVLIYRLISLMTNNQSLMTIFNWLKYLMLSFFPLVIYYSGRKFELSKIASAGSALVSTFISTQYLYGTDYNALVFRGSGLYTQLWGIFFLPLALCSIYDSLKYNRGYFKSVIFLSLTLSGHLVFGYMAVLATPVLLLSLSRSGLIQRLIKRLILILTSSFLLLSYWLIPLVFNSNYQNKSLFDDYTKFNSFGALQIFKWLVNGQIFDNARLPVLTIFVAMGFFYSLHLSLRGSREATDEAIFLQKRDCHALKNSDTLKISGEISSVNEFFSARNDSKESLLFFPLLFLFFLILYFGRYTFGSLYDLLPMSEGIHGHRFVNGVHFAGIFLIGLAIEWIYLQFKIVYPVRKNLKLKIFLFVTAIAIVFYPVYKERFDYLDYNNYSLKTNTILYEKELPDFQKAIDLIKQNGPGRIYIGRPGNWGRNFGIAGFSSYFGASVNNIDTIGFEPESWSPSTDIEQFFSEYDPNHYNLFNINYIIAPPDQDFAKNTKFAKKIGQFGKFIVYKVDTKGLTSNHLGNFEFINSDMMIFTKKIYKFNLDRLWIGSKYMPARNHPTVIYDYNSYNSYNDYNRYQNAITMLDLSNYHPGLSSQNREISNIFGQNPFSDQNPLLTTATPSGTVVSEKFDHDFFSASVENSKDSILMLKASFHPFWHATIDQLPTITFMVEPAFMAIRVPSGKHLVEFKYYPAWWKDVLIIVSLFTLPILYLVLKKFQKSFD